MCYVRIRGGTKLSPRLSVERPNDNFDFSACLPPSVPLPLSLRKLTRPVRPPRAVRGQIPDEVAMQAYSHAPGTPLKAAGRFRSGNSCKKFLYNSSFLVKIPSKTYRLFSPFMLLMLELGNLNH